MKKIFTIISAVLFLGLGKVGAQSFHMADDTVTVLTTGGSITVVDTVISTVAQTIQWKIVATNFPTSLQGLTQFCDQCTCNYWSAVSGTNTCGSYPAGAGDFHMVTDLSSMPTGCYYVKVKFNTTGIPVEADSAVLKVCKAPVGIATVKNQDDVMLYPNPATNELNVVYNASADIKNIAVYNIIGKAMAVYKVTDNNSANLNLESIPAGIYFVRLLNSHGEVVVTKKFTKQ
jgi:hypothetical protein